MSKYITTLVIPDESNATVVKEAAYPKVTRFVEGMPGPLPPNAVTSQQIDEIVVLTQAEFDALPVKDENTWYAIASEP